MQLVTSNPKPSDLVLGQPVGGRRREVLALPALYEDLMADIWGTTGSGKSRLQQSIFLQRHSKGQGASLLDIHHDTALAIIKYLTKRGFFRDPASFDRLAYLDYGNDGTSFIPFNILATNRSPKTVARHTLEAMYRVFPELRSRGASAFTMCWLAGVATLVANRLPLPCLYQLFTDDAFQAHCLEQVSDPLIHQTFARFGSSRQDTASLLRRSFALAFDDLMRLSLSLPSLAFNARAIMDRGISVIHNLGNIESTETKSQLAALILLEYQHAALSRTDTEEGQRVPHWLLLDEWPAYAASSNQTLSESLAQLRKFRTYVWLAAQSMGMVSEDLLDGALENCKLHIVFGLGRKSAHLQAQELATGVSQPKRSFFSASPAPTVPTTEEFKALEADIQTLDTALAYVKVHTQPAIKVKTLTVPDSYPDPAELSEVLREYQRRYHVSRAEAEANVASLYMPYALPAKPARPFTFFGDDDDASAGFFDGSLEA